MGHVLVHDGRDCLRLRPIARESWPVSISIRRCSSERGLRSGKFQVQVFYKLDFGQFSRPFSGEIGRMRRVFPSVVGFAHLCAAPGQHENSSRTLAACRQAPAERRKTLRARWR
jgi:hypothetical protein